MRRLGATMANVSQGAVAGIGTRWAMIPVGVSGMGSTSPCRQCVRPTSFALTRGPNVSKKLPLGTHVNSIAMVCSLVSFNWILSTHILLLPLDSCEPPSDASQLKDTSGQGRNFNGAVCLNFVCQCVFSDPRLDNHHFNAFSSGLRTLPLDLRVK
jgi:hypothetical protein